MYQYNSKTILVLAFGFMLLIIGGLSAIWAVNVNENIKNIEGIFAEQSQSRLVREMRDAARQRAILLHRMSLMTDEFQVDEAHMLFKAQAGRFIGARQQLLALEDEAGAELEIWKRAVPKIRNGEASQRKTLGYILNGQVYKANNSLIDEVIPIQNAVSETLSEMLSYQKKAAQFEFESAIARNTQIHTYVFVLGGSAVLLTFITALIVIRRTTYVESSLDEARVVAQTATELKSQFLANMSHEIRTPLTAVLGFAENMLDENQTAEERRVGSHSILRNGHHLMQVINDILDISKIEAKQLAIEHIEFSPVQLISEIDSLIGARVREKGLSLNVIYEFPLPEKINSDPTRLKQVILNLCSNAAKFTEQGGVEIRVSYSRINDEISFSVKDSGIGMEKESLSRLFKPFSQADDSTTRKYGGTGLGLYISRQLTQMLGGDLNCTSEKGKGSEFAAIIKADVNDQTNLITEIDTGSLKDTQHKKTPIPKLSGEVLLAEDSPDNQVLITMHIKKTGANITVVDNGKLAIESALEKQYDLILMDMQMPVMGGAEAVEWLRQTGNQTPIVMLTANAMKEERDKCISLGANDFLTKPIEKDLFYKSVAMYLNADESSDNENFVDDDSIEAEFEDLRNTFVSSFPEKMQIIKAHQNEKNWDAVKDVIHVIKGIGGGLGYPEITEKCREIEKSLAGTDADITNTLLDDLYNHCDGIYQTDIPKTLAS